MGIIDNIYEFQQQKKQVGKTQAYEELFKSLNEDAFSIFIDKITQYSDSLSHLSTTYTLVHMAKELYTYKEDNMVKCSIMVRSETLQTTYYQLYDASSGKLFGYTINGETLALNQGYGNLSYQFGDNTYVVMFDFNDLCSVEPVYTLTYTECGEVK